MTPWLCEAAKTLRLQVAELWPGRDKQSDGWIGDSKHSSRTSDHNPDWSSEPPGCVRAIDIDEDLLGAAMADPTVANWLADQLVGCGHSDARLRYVIFEGRIWRRNNGWLVEPYAGPNPHNHHIHVSFTTVGDHTGSLFKLGTPP